MSNLNELRVPDGVDEATRWGIWEEFNLRHEAYERFQLFQREGVSGVFRRITAIMTGEEVQSERRQRQSVDQSAGDVRS